MASFGLIQYGLPCEIRYLQNAELVQRGCATFRVAENFAKLLEVMRNYAVQ